MIRSGLAARLCPLLGLGTARVFLLAALPLVTGCGGGASPTVQHPVPDVPVGELKRPESLASSAIEVLSHPDGASIFLNGRLVGATPLKLPLLDPGAYSLRLERHGCSPRSVPLRVDGGAQVIREELQPEPTGTLEVEVEPRGAEVLLNGELLGQTPLKRGGIPVGVHEIIIRKTNYRPYTSIVRIEDGKTARFADQGKERHLLKDLIIEMLDGQIKSEPHRATHLLDKGHYLFINNRMAEAAEAFLQAEDVCIRPPVFPAEMPEDERAAELRLYSEDRKRVSRELARHRMPRSFEYGTVRDFNAAYEQAKQRRMQVNTGSWPWVEAKGRSLIGDAEYTQAIELYKAHLAQVKEGESAFPCLVELLKVRLLLRDLPGFQESFRAACALSANDPKRLLTVVRAALSYKDRIRYSQRSELWTTVEAPLRAVVEKTEGPPKGECAAELAGILVQQNRYADAIPLLELAARNAETDQQKEERLLQVAETLRQVKRNDESAVLYDQLSRSERESVRKRALAGLILLGVKKP